jgi:hypothetical protein
VSGQCEMSRGEKVLAGYSDWQGNGNSNKICSEVVCQEGGVF